MKKLNKEELINEVLEMETGDSIVVTDGQDCALTTTINKVSFLESEMILVGGFGSPISSYEIFDNLPDVTQDSAEQCVENVFGFFQENAECDILNVVLERKASNKLYIR